MGIKKIIEKIENDVMIAKQQGNPAIDSDKMLSYLGQLKEGAQVELEVSRELARYAHERNIEYFKATIEDIRTKSTNMLTAILETGASAAKSIILINGGAAVALLAFLSNAWGKGIVGCGVGVLVGALYMFGLGVFLGAVTMGLRYFSQACFGEALNQNIQVVLDNMKNQTDNSPPKSWFYKAGYFFMGLAICSGLGAYIMFLIGINKSIAAFFSQ